MLIGVPREVKNNESRVGLTPDNVREYVNHGHQVVVEAHAGEGAHYTDDDYRAAGATIGSVEDAWNAEMIVKVKEPIASEYDRMKEGQLLYTYLHLAADKPLTQALLDRKVTGIAYETMTDRRGGLPCLAPMSEIAGRLAIVEGMKHLQRQYGGEGILLPGVPGVERGKVVVIGGGVVGTAAARLAAGLGAIVTILDIDLNRLAYLEDMFKGSVSTLYSNRSNIHNVVQDADLVVGAVLIPGRKAPKLVLEEDIKVMKRGAVVVDVAIDQGGCIETAKPTTHDNPVYIEHDVVHYCVTNMPGSVARTSTQSLTNATLASGLLLADHGLAAFKMDEGLANGVNTHDGKVTCAGVADALGYDYVTLEDALA